METRAVKIFLAVALGAVALRGQDFAREVHPILAARCIVCHSQEKRSGGLSLATWQDTLDGGRSGATVKPGNSAGSLLVARITGEMQPRMPLGGDSLSAVQIATIRSWIDGGARETPASAPAKGKWEAPLTLVSPAVPGPTWEGWTEPVDRFVSAYFAKNKIAERQPVSDALFARRVYLDIWGLLPARDELYRFLSDQAPRKRDALIAKLLADDRKYAENWISFWNDLLRNDEGANYYSETASRKSITEWLFHALETNLPYDRFVSKLLNPAAAGDPEGFLIGVNWRGTVSASQTPAMQAAQNTAQIFLGINLKCNSCHDSFISRWKLKDAYALAAYFSDDPKLQLVRCDVAQQQFTEAGFPFAELNRAPASASLADRRAAAAAIFLDPRNGRLPRTLVNRIWQKMLGRGVVENPDEMDGEPFSPELLDWLSADFVEHGYDVKRLIATIARSRTYQMPAGANSGAFQGPAIRRMTAEEFADAVGSITGEWHVNQGKYGRDWRVASTPLTRALGRPIRDQVYSVRDDQATTLQALELVNGEALTHWLGRGARRMLGELPDDPVSLFDQPYVVKNGPVAFDIDISKAKKLWLLVQDRGSYSPEKVEAIWRNAELTGPKGATPLASLKPLKGEGLRGADMRVKTPSEVVYDIEGKGSTRLRGAVAIENTDVTSDINPQIRFFVFDREPDWERLTPVAPEVPLPAAAASKDAGEIVNRVYWQALARAPSAGERRIGESAVRGGADGVADFLWAVLMMPEFQLIL